MTYVVRRKYIVRRKYNVSRTSYVIAVVHLVFFSDNVEMQLISLLVYLIWPINTGYFNTTKSETRYLQSSKL